LGGVEHPPPPTKRATQKGTMTNPIPHHLDALPTIAPIYMAGGVVRETNRAEE
jgi:hypothetical protein